MTPLDLNTYSILHNKQHEHILPKEKDLPLTNSSFSCNRLPSIDTPSSHRGLSLIYMEWQQGTCFN